MNVLGSVNTSTELFQSVSVKQGKTFFLWSEPLCTFWRHKIFSFALQSPWTDAPRTVMETASVLQATVTALLVFSDPIAKKVSTEMPVPRPPGDGGNAAELDLGHVLAPPLPSPPCSLISRGLIGQGHRLRPPERERPRPPESSTDSSILSKLMYALPMEGSFYVPCSFFPFFLHHFHSRNQFRFLRWRLRGLWECSHYYESSIIIMFRG